MLANLLQHALHSPLLVKPGGDLRAEDRDGAGALARGRLVVNGLTEHTRDGIAVVAQKVGDLGLAPALLVEVVNSRAIHEM